MRYTIEIEIQTFTISIVFFWLDVLSQIAKVAKVAKVAKTISAIGCALEVFGYGVEVTRYLNSRTLYLVS